LSLPRSGRLWRRTAVAIVASSASVALSSDSRFLARSIANLLR
jgi:hypothetical protein